VVCAADKCGRDMTVGRRSLGWVNGGGASGYMRCGPVPSRKRAVERDRMVPIARSAAYTIDSGGELAKGRSNWQRR
jgi:hypothetical protein